MSSHVGHGTSRAIRRFAGWVARGSVGPPVLLSGASSARRVVAAAAVLTAVVGSAVALGSSASSASSASRASDPGTLVVHPAAVHVRGGFMAPVPFSDAQCEAVFQISCYVPDQVEAAYNLPALYSR